MLAHYDPLLKQSDPSEAQALCEEANAAVTDALEKLCHNTLDLVLFETSNLMKNAYARSDA